MTAVTATVYTDGACLGNPGPGGWAWARPGGAYASGAEAQSTNQRMEIMAALEAVRAIPGALIVVSDSTYVVNCYNDRWYEGWERKGWINSSRKPVANQDLWKPLVQLFHARGSELTFRWVKGHSGDAMNDLVDRLAVEAAQTQSARQGTEPPTDLGPADRPAGRGRRDGGGTGGRGAGSQSTTAPDIVIGGSAAPITTSSAALDVVAAPTAAPTAAAAPTATAAADTAAGPAAWTGHRVLVLGHRPPDLGGYGDNPVAAALRRRLADILAGLRAVHPDLVVLTGLGLGTEQLAAEAASRTGIPYIAVLAFPDPDAVWPAESKAAYRRLVAGAKDTIVLSKTKPATKQAAGQAIHRRDAWLVGQADSAIVVWDGKDRTIGDSVKALEQRLPDDVWVVEPPPP
jgi:ribonuclease HI